MANLTPYTIFSQIRREIGMTVHSLNPYNIQPCLVKVLEFGFVSRVRILMPFLDKKKSLASRENSPSTISRIVKQF